jgi:hydrogenase nickel incorporation protein HypA/HybF
VHEFSIAEALATQVLAHAPAGARVRGVEIRVGGLRGLEPDALQMAWDSVTFGTAIQGATLAIDLVPWTVKCSECGREWTSPVPFVSCECGNARPNPVGTDELDLMAMTVDQDDGDEEVGGEGEAGAP